MVKGLSERAAALASEVVDIVTSQNLSRRKAGAATLKIARRLHALKTLTPAQQHDALGMPLGTWVKTHLIDEKGKHRSYAWAHYIMVTWEEIRNYPELVADVEEERVSFSTMTAVVKLARLDNWLRRAMGKAQFATSTPLEKDIMTRQLFIDMMREGCSWNAKEITDRIRRAEGRPENRKVFLGGWILPEELQDWKEIVAACEALVGEDAKAKRFPEELTVVREALGALTQASRKRDSNEEEEPAEERGLSEDGQDGGPVPPDR